MVILIIFCSVYGLRYVYHSGYVALSLKCICVKILTLCGADANSKNNEGYCRVDNDNSRIRSIR